MHHDSGRGERVTAWIAAADDGDLVADSHATPFRIANGRLCSQGEGFTPTAHVLNSDAATCRVRRDRPDTMLNCRFARRDGNLLCHESARARRPVDGDAVANSKIGKSAIVFCGEVEFGIGSYDHHFVALFGRDRE